MIRAGLVLTLVLAGPALAVEFNLPATARQTVERNTSPDIYAAPVGVFRDGVVPTVTIEGDVRRSAWRLESAGLTPFQVMRPLRDQLIAEGFSIALDCQAQTCGGFDFRFATETLPGPNMYVNIRAYQFVTGLRRSNGAVDEAVTLFVSTSATSAYIQIIHAGGTEEQAVSVDASAAPIGTAEADQPADIASTLLVRGHAILTDLDFGTGTTELGAGPFDSLSQLAAFLVARPEVRVALVGHTDTVGGLQPNISISRARAQSVRQRLITTYAIDPARLDAEGMGYLAPVASNLDAAGREQNRRVEVILLDDG